jgi:hypothetical protein
MNIETTGTHKASEILESVAGSERNSAPRRMSQRTSANVGGIVSMDEADRARAVLPDHLLRKGNHFQLLLVLAVLTGLREHIL